MFGWLFDELIRQQIEEDTQPDGTEFMEENMAEQQNAFSLEFAEIGARFAEACAAAECGNSMDILNNM